MGPSRAKILLTLLDWVCRVVVAAYFVLAAVPKLQDPTAFAKAITNYRLELPIIGMNYAYAVASFMPGLELAGAIALLIGPWKRAGSVVVGFLLVLFIALIGQAVARGLNIDCGCFGTGVLAQALAQKVGLQKLLENVILLAMTVFVGWRAKKG